MRIAIIDKKKCRGKKCPAFCISVCPGVKMGEETITRKGEFPVISEELCTGCGLCVKACPTSAIKIVNTPQELEKPTFQYGANSFRLYNFAMPKNSRIVGIIGENGIGKSTALKLSSGKIKPNFGEYEKEMEWKEILDRFKGSETRGYLEQLKKNKIKFAYKIQEVGALSKSEEKVKNFLKICGKNKEKNNILKELGIEKIKEKKLNELSGGELQKIAIACTLMKDAEVYFFDEPSSYLDVKERINVGKLIRKLALTKSVLLVEHDLALLDYLSDFIYVIYGKRGAYGVISSIKSCKNGINEYLAGYLKSENVRFRKETINFGENMRARKIENISLKYPLLHKTFENFKLEIEGAEIKEGEIIGIVGPNAIGKSTFVKVLAGVIKADENYKAAKRVAYKPQYLERKFDGKVRELIKKVDMKRIKEKLKINEIEDKEVKELSGGELQALSIALNLSMSADLRLLDEPSSFLDVEQRIYTSDAIRNIAAITEVPTFVVDHDLLFVASVSDRMIVFEGVPGVYGKANKIASVEAGLNKFLKDLNITFRRDPITGRLRANKENSIKDVEQKREGKYIK